MNLLKPTANFLKFSLTILISISFLTACSKDDKDDKKPKTSEEEQANFQTQAARSRSIHIQSVDGKGIANAQVLIGNESGHPFANNFVTTDASGNFIAPAAWSAPLAVTISAPGFVRVSFLKQIPKAQIFVLRKAEKSQSYELTGQTSGFNIVNSDGIVDIGLVITALKKQDLFNFDIGMVISPQIDQMTVLGQKVNIPSNITIPKQKESYIFPLTLEKSAYRMYFGSGGTKNIFSGYAQFPLKTFVDKMKKGVPFFELVNDITILSGALKNVDVTNPKSTADLNVNELIFNQSRLFNSPVIDGNQFMISLALSEYLGNLFPTDVKNIEANSQIKLVTAAGSTPLLLTVLKNKSEAQAGPGVDRLSAALIPFDNNASPNLLPLMKDPQVVSPQLLRLEKTAIIQGLMPVASYAVLSSLDEKSQVTDRLWEVYDQEWSEEFILPVWPNEKPTSGKKRWEVSRVAAKSSSKVLDLGPQLFESASHATHSSADF